MELDLECDMVRERNSELKFAVFPTPVFLIRAPPPPRHTPNNEKVDNIKPQIKRNCKKYTTRNWWVPQYIYDAPWVCLGEILD